MQKKTIVAGAGLVGSLLAIILQKQGHDVELFEKRGDFTSADFQAGRSINLIITAKGVKALKDTGIYEKIVDLTIPVYGRMMHSPSGEETYQPYGKDRSEYNLSVSRSLLNIELIKLAKETGVKVCFDHEIKNINFVEQSISFNNNRTYFYDYLFGTDGAGSVVRKELVKFEGGESLTDWLGSDYKELLMPAYNSKYPLEKNALHIWPRGSEFLMALPNLEGSFTMTLYMNESKFSEIQSREQIENLFSELYPDSIALMPNYIEDYLNNPVGKLGTVFCDTWTNNKNVLLVGDAAHAIVPFFGQGMNLGFNDCSLLTELFKKYENMVDICREYQKIQKPAADAIANMAIENFTEMQEKVADESFLNRKKIEHEIENTFPELYRSRYALVTYTLVPYDHCQKIGEIQNDILDCVINGKTWDKDKTLNLIKEKLIPYYENNSISISSYLY